MNRLADQKGSRGVGLARLSFLLRPQPLIDCHGRLVKGKVVSAPPDLRMRRDANGQEKTSSNKARSISLTGTAYGARKRV